MTGNPVAAGLRQSGNLFAFFIDVVKAVPRRPFQIRELIQQAWFISSVSILPAALVSIPFGAVIALQLGSLVRQLGAQSFTGAASVLAVVREAGPIVTALVIAGPAVRRSAPTWARGRSARSWTRCRCWASTRSSGSWCLG